MQSFLDVHAQICLEGSQVRGQCAQHAGYENGFERLFLSERVTHPRNHGFPDATFDFIFAKGLTALQPTVTQTNASDHWPVTRNFRLP